MLQYLFRRLLLMIPTLLGITFVTFLILRLAPGDPIAAAMGRQGAEGGGAGGDSGGGSQEKQADAIKTKKKLLGFLEDDTVVRAWSARIEPGATERAKQRGAADPLEQTADVGTLPAHPRCLTWSASSSRLWAGSADGIVRVLAPDGSAPITIPTGAGDVWSIAVLPDGSAAAVGDAAGTFRVVGFDGRPRGEPVALGKPVRRIVVAKDAGRDVFLSACDDGGVRLHDPATGAVRREFRGQSSYVAGLAVSADGSRFWTAGYDRKVRAWTVADGTSHQVVAEAGQPVNDLALSPDGARLAAACDDRTVRVWTLGAAGAAPLVVQGHYKSVTCVAFSPDGTKLWSGSRDGSARAWDAVTGAPLAITPADQGPVTAIVPSRDGASVWTASESTRPTPVWKQYGRWIGRIATFDFDRSLVTNEKVVDKILEALPVTIGMNAIAVLVTYLVAIPWGVFAAVKRGRAFDRISSVILFMLWSLPNYWVATLLIMWFSSKRNFDWFPSVGLHATNAKDLAYLPWLGDFAAHMVLPLIVMTYGSFTGLTQYMRTSMLENIQQDFVRTARAKGLPERLVIFKHALRNSLITMVTLFAGLLPGMIGGSLFVEIIFSIDGMGKLSYTAVLGRDYPVIMAVTTLTAFMTLLGVLVSDLLYGVVDPRVRHA